VAGGVIGKLEDMIMREGSQYFDGEVLYDCDAAIEIIRQRELEVEQAMSDEFVRNNTPYSDFEKLVLVADCERPTFCEERYDKFDKFLKANTKFENWPEMFKAGSEYFPEFIETKETSN
jgi:hypothetical protein